MTIRAAQLQKAVCVRLHRPPGVDSWFRVSPPSEGSAVVRNGPAPLPVKGVRKAWVWADYGQFAAELGTGNV